MNEYPRYTLQATRNGLKKLTCPQCGRKRCLVPYVNAETGEVLDPTCGRCDHQNSCGYHKPPREFFRERGEPYEARTLSSRATSYTHKGGERKRSQELAKENIYYFAPETFLEFLQNSDTLRTYVESLCGEEATADVWEDYMICESDGQTIFPYIDQDGRIRTAKIMRYGADGHRKKFGVDWLHARWIRCGKLPAETKTKICLFGEHLLKLDADKPVAIVESEKTALMCATLVPSAIWLASGGCQFMSEDRLSVLRGRKLVLFPDCDAVEEWCKRVKVDYVSGFCRYNQMAWQMNNDKADLADFIEAAFHRPRSIDQKPDTGEWLPHLRITIERTIQQFAKDFS